MNDNTNTDTEASPVTGIPHDEDMLSEALADAREEIGSLVEETDDLFNKLATWLHREFHMIPKTAEEKIATQNLAAVNTDPKTAV